MRRIKRKKFYGVVWEVIEHDDGVLEYNQPQILIHIRLVPPHERRLIKEYIVDSNKLLVRTEKARIIFDSPPLYFDSKKEAMKVIKQTIKYYSKIHRSQKRLERFIL